MTDIERQLCDILGLTSEFDLAAEVKSLHDRFGYHVSPARAVIPCFCGDITRITREKLGAKPTEPVFSAAERVTRDLRIATQLCGEGAAKIEDLKQQLADTRARLALMENQIQIERRARAINGVH